MTRKKRVKKKALVQSFTTRIKKNVQYFLTPNDVKSGRKSRTKGKANRKFGGVNCSLNTLVVFSCPSD